MTAFGSAFLAFSNGIGAGSRLRLAPTPSGFLHAGNAFNFILNWLATRLHPGARLLLRIDDLDAERKRPEYVQDVFDTLAWLELDWDEGPRDALDFENNWSQYHRIPLYEKTLDALRREGYLFACGKSRRELAPFGAGYPAEFRNQGLSLDQPEVAWRIRTPQPFPLPDFIVRRRDGIPAYQIASLSDDHHFGVSHVIRGEDLRDSSEAQLFLAACLAWPDMERLQILHHPLLLNDRQEKLSKSAGAQALRSQRLAEMSPVAIFEQVAQVLGLPAPGAIQSARALLVSAAHVFLR
ncbi:MAG: hypothetical protein IT260_19810 [Saprospiraceae bacterium]|nr:hypothetical protein [Saprospiraceae bacterium]